MNNNFFFSSACSVREGWQKENNAGAGGLSIWCVWPSGEKVGMAEEEEEETTCVAACYGCNEKSLMTQKGMGDNLTRQQGSCVLRKRKTHGCVMCIDREGRSDNMKRRNNNNRQQICMYDVIIICVKTICHGHMKNNMDNLINKTIQWRQH